MFQSTSPVWRTTCDKSDTSFFNSVSIHVPRVEDDPAEYPPPTEMLVSIHVPRVEDDSCSARS